MSPIPWSLQWNDIGGYDDDAGRVGFGLVDVGVGGGRDDEDDDIAFREIQTLNNNEADDRKDFSFLFCIMWIFIIDPSTADELWSQWSA